jgi:hypothetical protein
MCIRDRMALVKYKNIRLAPNIENPTTCVALPYIEANTTIKVRAAMESKAATKCVMALTGSFF